MTYKSGYQKAMMYQKRLDEQNGVKPLPTPYEFIKMCGVTASNPDSIMAMSSLIREALCIRDDLENNKKHLLTATLNILEKGTIPS